MLAASWFLFSATCERGEGLENLEGDLELVICVYYEVSSVVRLSGCQCVSNGCWLRYCFISHFKDFDIICRMR